MANRFADNTTVLPVNRTRVLGYAPGWTHFMELDPLGSNQQSRQIPQGQLIVFKPHVNPGYDGDFNYLPVENTAQYYADNLTNNFHHGENDWGYRTLNFLTDLPYDKETGWDEADEYFEVLHPQLTCEMGLEIPTESNLNVPVPCPTCRLKWLKSTECEAAIQSSPKDYHTLTTFKDTLIASQEAALRFARKKLDETKGDMQKARAGAPGKAAYQDCDYHYMNMLHKKPDHIEQADLMNRQAQIQGEAIAAGVRGANNDPTSGMSNAEKAEFYTWKAEKEAKAVEPTPAAYAHLPIGTITEIPQDENAVYESANDSTIDFFNVGAFVSYEGQRGVIEEVKTAGWFAVKLESGETVKLRKDKLALVTD